MPVIRPARRSNWISVTRSAAATRSTLLYPVAATQMSFRCFAAAIAARLLDRRVAAHAHGTEGIKRGGDARGFLDLLAGGVRAAESDVVGDGRAEEETLLEDRADVA